MKVRRQLENAKKELQKQEPFTQDVIETSPLDKRQTQKKLIPKSKMKKCHVNNAHRFKEKDENVMSRKLT